MPTRKTAPIGAPCWTDLWTSDVPGARHFYGELFGWDAEDPEPAFGGYFSFLRGGVRIAGCMGDMGEMRANNSWKIYLASDDIDKTVSTARREGAQVLGEPMAVAELGSQALIVDPTGAGVGIWQSGTHPGFTVLEEPGAPSWFELHTREHARSVDFYRTVFRLDTYAAGDTDEFRYTIVRDPGGSDLAGIMDAAGFLPQGAPAAWSTYWYVDDVDAAASTVKKLGGSVVQAPEATPYGRLAAVTDHVGAGFKLRSPAE